MKTGSWIRAVVVALGLAAPMSAQLPPQQQPGARGALPQANRLQMERRLQQAFAQRVRVELGLNPAQATALGDATLGFQRERQDLVRRENELRRRYRMEAAEAGGARAGAPAVPDAEALEILRELRALRAAELDLYTREQERLLQLLTPAQVVRYYLLREQLADRINGLRGGAAGGGRAAPAGGRRAPGPPPPDAPPPD
jgi:hypothetical protein